MVEAAGLLGGREGRVDDGPLPPAPRKVGGVLASEAVRAFVSP